MIQAIIFDVDGTLLDTERIYMKSWKLAGELFGYDIPDDTLLKTRAVNKPAATAIFKAEVGEDFDYNGVRKERIRFSEEMILAYTPEELQMPAAADTLQYLKEKGLLLAVASSSTRQETDDHLGHAGLLHYFQAVVGGDMVQNGKPNPDIFLKAADLLQVPIENCLVVGDTPADVLAAHAANIPMILVPDLVAVTDQTRSLSRHILTSLAELPALVDTYLETR